MRPPPDGDVLVVGYGPVGAVLAALLGQRGLAVTVVERDLVPYPLPRAIATDDEVLRILVRLPGLGNLPDRLNAWQRAAFVDADRRVLAELAFGETELGQSGLAFLHQPSLERSLRAAVASLPSVRVLPGRAVEALSQADDAVTVVTDDGGRLRARYVVGCDGATSTVRGALGLGFEGTTAAQAWLVVDVETDQPLRQLPYFCYVCDPARPAVTMPMPGGHRWEWMVLPDEDPREVASAASVRALLSAYVEPGTVRIARAEVYTAHTRMAPCWRVGRVLLAGDAAHCMPQFAGQGLGAGIRDAAALAWRLDEIVRGVSDAALLDQYEAERRPHVEAMTDLALLAGRVLQPTNPRTAALTRRALRAAAATPPLAGWLARGDVRPRSAMPPVRLDGRPIPGGGRVLPNPRVRTLAGRVARLDDVLPWCWALVALGRDPTAGLEPAASAWLADRQAAVLAVVPPGGLSAAVDLRCPVAEDLDGTLLRLLRRAGQRSGWPGRLGRPGRRGRPGWQNGCDGVAVVRPDRFLLGVLPSASVGETLRRWPNDLRPVAGGDLRTALVRRLAGRSGA